MHLEGQSSRRRKGKNSLMLLASVTYIDNKCPVTGSVSIRGRIIAGTCHNAKMDNTIIVRRNYLHFVKKYQRPLSKTVRFNVLKVPAGTSGGGKKAFTVL